MLFFYVKESASVSVLFRLFYAKKQTLLSHWHRYIKDLNWWAIA